MSNLPWYLQNLLSYSLQLCILIGMAVLVEKLFPLRLPRLSYAYWRVLLLVSLALPLFEPWPAPAQGLLSGSPFSMMEDVSAIESQLGAPAQAEWQIPYLPLLAGILAAGTLFRFSRLLVGALTLRRALRRARPAVLPWDMSQLVPGGEKQPRVCCVERVNSPATYGLFRPVILLPVGFSDLTQKQQLGVICHELRHVQRHDWLFRLAEEIIRSLFWFHPLVLWLTRRIELSREQAVDQEVVQMLGRPSEYLDSLVEMASARLSGPVAALFLSESYLRQRVRLIKEGFTMSTRRLSISLALSVVVLLAAGTLAVWAFPLQGREQESARPGGAPAGSAIESQKRRPETDRLPEASLEPIRVGGNVMTGKLIHWVPPEYPPDAEKARIKGLVLVRVTVSEEGDVTGVEGVRGHPMLVQAAVAAVQQWKYSPTMLEGRAVQVIATQAVTFPPGKEPVPVPSGQQLFADPERVGQVRLDQTGALFLGAQRLDADNLAQALQGKDDVALFGVPQDEPSIEVIQASIKMLEQSGVRVQFFSPSYRYVDGRVIPSPGTLVLPVRALAETGKLLGYAQYRWVFREDGRQIESQGGRIPEASEEAIATARSMLNSWTITATYQLSRDAEGRITDARRIGGSAVPVQVDEVVTSMIGKTYPGLSGSSTVELEISFR